LFRRSRRQLQDHRLIRRLSFPEVRINDANTSD
jgi:hypothetical protein